MEQHRVLLIIVSVTIVLAAVVGVGLWLFYPRDGAEAGLAEGITPESGGYEWQPLDYLQGEGDVPGLEDTGSAAAEEPDEFEVTYGVLPDAETSITAGTQTIIDTTDTAADVPGDTSTPAPTPVTTTRPGVAGAAADVHVSTAPPETTTTTSYSGAASATSTAGAPTVSAAASSAPDTDVELADRAYWVQAISSPNRDTVEQAQLTLRDHQLGSRILTKVIDERTYFRLRVGPFAVRAEAEKFLGWVQDISGFGDAMIFVDYTTPVLAARP